MPLVGDLESYAGQAPEDADRIAEEHQPFPAELPPVPDGDVVDVRLTLRDVTIEIAT